MEKCGGKVHDKGAVEITASIVYDNDPSFGPRNAADFGDNSEFCLKNKSGQWICWRSGSRAQTTGLVDRN
jgi:hypothetical protein